MAKKQPKKGKVTIKLNKREAIRQLVAKGSYQSGIREHGINGLDAYPDSENFTPGEALVNYQIKPGEYIRIQDWGEGFSQQDVDGYFDLLNSKKKGNRKKTGRIGSGRTHCFSFCTEIEIYSVSKDFPGGVRFSYKEEDLYREGEDSEFDFDIDLPSFWHADNGTGTVVILKGIDWRKVQGGKDPELFLREWLPTKMSDFAAAVVTVNDKPLKALTYLKEPLRGEKVIEQLGGLCRWSLFIPTANQRGEKAVMLGGQVMPIVSIPQFLRGVRTELHQFIPELLLDGSVLGHIMVPIVNDFRNHDSESLNEKIYDRVADDVLALLAEIGQEAERYFAESVAEAEKVEESTFLRNLTDQVNSVTGFNPDDLPSEYVSDGPLPRRGKAIPRPAFFVTPSDLQLVKSTSVPTTICAYSGTSGEFDCQVEGDACVTVTKQTNREFVITGDALGKATLVYTDRKDPSKRFRSPIEIVESAGLQLTPLKATIAQGETGRAAVAHPESLDGADPKYDVNAKKSDIRLSPRRRGVARSVGIDVSRTCPPGEYVITAKVEGGLTATATRTVVRPVDYDPPMRIEDRFYRITRSGMEQGVLAHVNSSDDYDLTPGSDKKIREVKVYIGHPLLTACKDAMQRQLLILDSLFQIHLELLIAANELQPEERNARFDTIRKDIFGPLWTSGKRKA